MSRSIRPMLSGIAIVVCLTNVAHAADFGRTTGQFGVSQGSATYSIPILTPPGPNGITPSIDLKYNSSSGNGLGGVGWHLSAVSSIERCARTAPQDGNAAPVDLTSGDRFCLGGNRLRLDSGTYGSAGSVYYTEIADYSRITAYGTAGNGPQYFVVEAKSGLKYEYGATTSSRVLLGSTALRWMLNKVYDRNGNNYVVSYNTANGFAVPDTISWTPTYLYSSSYRYEAKFNYSTSRTDEDSFIGKIAGFDVSNRNRLEYIQIKSAGVVIRRYSFTYNTSLNTKRSLLATATECADDAQSNCFLPLTFSYQTGQTGVSGTSISAMGSSSSLVRSKYDFNGDGKSDLLYVSGGTWFVSLSTGAGFGAGISTGVPASATYHVQRFLANHQDGILRDQSGTWYYVGYNNSTGVFVSTSTGISVPPPTVAGAATKVTDNNGDGLGDLVWTVGGNVMLRLNTTVAGASSPSFSSTPITAYTFSVGSGNVGITDAKDCPFERMCDVNGDGRADLLVNVVSVTGCGMSGCTITNTKYDLYGLGSGYGIGPAVGAIGYRGIYFNDDRCIDRVPNAAPSTLEIAGCNIGALTTISLPATASVLMDWNGDKKTDILVASGGFFGVYLSKGNIASPFSALVPTSIPVSPTCNYFVFDPDGDGADDLGCVGTGSPFAVSYYPHNGSGGVYLTQEPDLLSSVSDGYGVNIAPSYVSTAQSNYTRATGTQIPLYDDTDPITVVAQVTSSNGIGGTYTKTYNYYGARRNIPRAESAGFQRIDEIDSRNSVINRTYFEQLFPLAGMVSQLEAMQPGGVTAMARTVFTNNFATINTTPFNQRYFPYVQGSTSTEYEVGSAWNGNLLRTVSTSNIYDNASGTLYDKTVTTTEPASGANGVTAGGSWTARTYSNPSNFYHDTTNWCLGRPGKTQQINSHNLVNYGGAITRTTDITWNTSLCRPTQTIEEDNTALEVVTDIGYDAFGNINSTTVTGSGMTARTTSSVYSDATYTTGQFPISATNALSQTTYTSWDYDLGVPTSITDPNGILTSWDYDPFGRRVLEDRPDGTSTTWSVNNCTAVPGGCVGSNNKTVVIETALDSAANYINDIWTYLDTFDRPIISVTRVGSGSYNRIDRVYDSLGRVYQESAPCIWASCTTYWTTNSYDLANRLTQISRPISDSNPAVQYTNLYYEGLTARAVDAEGKESKKIENAVGQLARSADHAGYYQTFEYDAFGAPKRVQDSAGNTLQSSTYNLRGMLTARTDLDMGAWSFTPNALGEVVSQTDAKSQTTSFAFDGLGRLTSRTEAEGTSTWTWGTSSGAKNIGRLASVSGPGYSETYTYDSVGRPSSTSISADTTYQIDYAYNVIGALDTLTYPTSTSSYRLKIHYNYQYGQLHRIQECTNVSCSTTGTNYWSADAFNARNQITQETLGNGLVTTRSSDAVTGWLGSIQTSLSSAGDIQQLTYEWDKIGNLKKRKDINQSNLTEEFFYDNLHRLDYSTLNSVQNLDMSYDALGNITYKSDVGTYTYHSSKVHQVISTNNGWSFGYDNNGNMTSGRGATITWTSYNYPASIANGSDTSSFSYTPDRQYWKQVSNYTSGGSATTIYVGGLLEKVTTSAGTDYRHMIRAGGATIIISRQSSGTNSVYYVTSDHLGSSSAITNGGGGVLVNSSFGAFGARRGSNWAGSPNSGDWSGIASTTRRGFTDQTMLDNLSLIHMNGRVQDPVLGRFVSADPHIPGRGNTQNFNRYSYVTNNPLSYLDPSGFCPEVATTDEDCDPTVTVTGHREPWVEDGASSAEQRLGPCQFFGGGYLSPLACQTVSAPIGMGTATADYMAAIHRQGMQEVVVCANCDRPNSTYDRGLIATDRWMDGSDLITTAAWLAILRRHYELYAQYPINAKIPSMLEQGYFVRVLSELRASKAYMDKLSKLGNILAWGGVSLGGLQLLEGHETENLDMQVDGLFNVGAGFATIFGGFAGAAFGVFEASGVRGWMMDAWDSAIDFQFETIRNMCGNDVACTDQAIYTFNPGMLISP